MQNRYTPSQYEIVKLCREPVTAGDIRKKIKRKAKSHTVYTYLLALYKQGELARQKTKDGKFIYFWNI